jgi:Bacterial PH domain
VTLTPAGAGGAGHSADWARLHAPFRPRRARRVALVVAVAQFAVLLTVALVLPSDGPVAFHWYDRAGVVGVGAAVAWFLSRYVLLVAEPSDQGLRVRNLLFARELSWAQIVAVRMGNGDPWVTLDVSDGDCLAVMAVQRADGSFGRAEADRLATLVAVHASRSDR